MPNGMLLEQALLPGWAPDAMQLIHFYSWEQVSRASQAASLETTLFIWPQAPEKSEGVGHRSVTTSSRNALRVPRGAAVQHAVPLHGCAARFSPEQRGAERGGLRGQPQHRLSPPRWGQGAVAVPTPRSCAAELVASLPQQPVLQGSRRLHRLTCTSIK